MILSELREKIDTLNRELVSLIAKRMEIAREIARIKKQKKLPVFDEKREKAIQEEIQSMARSLGLSAPIMEEIFDLLLRYTRLEMESSP